MTVMQRTDMLWLWVVGYLVMDATYVMLSRDTYMASVSKIAGSAPQDVTKVILCAIGAYTLMAIGWACIVVPMVRSSRGRKGSFAVVDAAKAGALYGAVLYGVFNFTTGAMFDSWSYAIMARDMVWGTMSIAAYTALFSWGLPSPGPPRM